MVRLADLSPAQREALPRLECPEFEHRPWVRGGPLGERRVAIVSTAGLMLRGERPVTANDSRFRAIPDDADAGDVLMSHASVNFDRTGFQRDMNVVLPRDRLRELAEAGVIGGPSATHYSHMGAVDPVQLEKPTRELAGTLRAQGVDSAVLLPV
jgi:D-proline reductase (dithiol) PrdB